MEDVVSSHHPTAGDALVDALERMHKKEVKRHRRAVKNMREMFAACMENEANSPPEAQVEFIIRVTRWAPQALDLRVVSKWMRQEAVACLLDDAARTFLIEAGANP